MSYTIIGDTVNTAARLVQLLLRPA
jgi:class 3 adenylate cyclase